MYYYTSRPGGDNDIPNGIDRPTDEGEVLPIPPTSDGSTPGGITDRPLGKEEVLPTPPETTTQEENDITNRPADGREVLPIMP